MAEINDVRIPKLGVYVDGMRLTAWLIDEGARVEVGEPLFELESDKASQEVEADTAGWVHHGVEPDAEVEVGQVVGLVAASEQAYQAAIQSGPIAAVAAPEGANGRGTPVPDPAPGPVTSAAARPAHVAPRARRLLEEHGLSADAVVAWAGLGPDGRLTDRDVQAYVDRDQRERGAPALGPTQDGTADGLTVTERIPLRGRRGIIAARMVASIRDAPQLTSTLEIDARAALRARERAEVRHVSVFAEAVARALRACPGLNALVEDEEIRVIEPINLAIAVETDDGVIAPVVHAADGLALAELDARIGELVDRARGGRCTPAELSGATFTLSSSGRHPVDLTTAILSPPQVGILWLGQIRERAVVEDGTVVAAPTIQACLTYDHRAVDGGPAAAFLGAFAAALEQA